MTLPTQATSLNDDGTDYHILSHEGQDYKINKTIIGRYNQLKNFYNKRFNPADDIPFDFNAITDEIFERYCLRQAMLEHQANPISANLPTDLTPDCPSWVSFQTAHHNNSSGFFVLIA